MRATRKPRRATAFLTRTRTARKGTAAKRSRHRQACCCMKPGGFWDAPRPHLSTNRKYDLGALIRDHGAAHIGLDLTTFPYRCHASSSHFKPNRRLIRAIRLLVGSGWVPEFQLL